MSYFDKINKNCKDNLVSLPCMPSMAIPHQSFTPREILAQFVRNDVQVQRLQPTDEVDTLDAMSFEDEFEARQFVSNELPEILEQRKQDKSDLEKRQTEMEFEQKPEQNPEQKPEQNPETKPVKVEVVQPEKPYTTGKGPYD